MISFGGWPEEYHYDYEQVQRIIAAQDKKITKGIVKIDKSTPKIIIQGSGNEPYEATLKECTCTDFIFRQAPCKHMYRLAFELGLMNDLPQYDKSKSVYDQKEWMRKYRDMYVSGEIPGEVYVALCKALKKL